MRKRIISVLLVLCLFFSVMPNVFAHGNEIRVTINGIEVSFDRAPIIENNRTLVMFRPVFERLGIEYDWNRESLVLAATKNDITVSATVNKKDILVNGEKIATDTPLRLIDRYAYIPLRSVCEAFGYTVDWNGTNNVVNIEAKDINQRNGGLSMFNVEKPFEERIALLKDAVMSSEAIKNIYSPEMAFDTTNPYTVFISVCDAKSRAIVFHKSADTVSAAWDETVKEVSAYINEKGYNPIWIKADVVDSMSKITQNELKNVLVKYFNEFYRYGISLDDKFDVAFLEAEINGNKLIDYKGTKRLDKDVINTHLEYYGKEPIGNIPKELVIFTCRGFMCDENSVIYELNDFGDNDGLDYGRRSYPVDRHAIEDVVLSSSYWLSNEIQENGKFNYGYYPTYDKVFTTYNMLRHTTGLLPLVWSWEITGDEKLKNDAESVLDYLLDTVVEKSPGVAYIYDVPNKEIKLGGNGLAIIAIDTYMDAFGKSESLVQICEELGEGILELQGSDGSYYHVLNPDFTKKESFRTVYYDGEATYGLCVLYKLTGDKKWLDAAQKSVDYFIENDYTVHRDHWVAYALNEITKYIPQEKYFDFGLKNLVVNMKKIHNQKTTYHTYMELLMAGFEMYDRMIQQNIKSDYLEEIDADYFARTIQKRAEHMLNGFLYPEYAMYLKNPEAIVGTFCVRHDGYRIRVDDVDHFVAGYYHYYELYDEVQKYIKE